MSLKVCVIGCGSIANAMHGPAYLKYKAENKEAVMAGCCDLDAVKAGDFKEKFGFMNAYTDMDEMLVKEKPDAVCLISPVQSTAALAEKILEAGIPLLLEKPPGRTRQEVTCLAEIAEKQKVPNRVAFNRRYAPLVRKLKEWLSDDPGPIQSVQYDMLRVNRLDEDFSTTAIHAIDAVRHITGSDYKSVRFTYHEYPELGKNVTDIHIFCEMKSGAIVKLNICPVTGIIRERAVINTFSSTCFLDNIGNGLNPSGRLVVARNNEIVLDLDGDNAGDGTGQFEREGFYYENKSFFDDIIAGRKPSGDLASAIQSVAAAACIRDREAECRW